MKATRQKQRCLALRGDLLECFCIVGDGVLIYPLTQQEEVVMTSRPVGQEKHCSLVVILIHVNCDCDSPFLNHVLHVYACRLIC